MASVLLEILHEKCDPKSGVMFSRVSVILDKSVKEKSRNNLSLNNSTSASLH